MLRTKAQRQRFGGHKRKVVNEAEERIRWPESMESEKGIYTFRNPRIPGTEKPVEAEDESRAREPSALRPQGEGGFQGKPSGVSAQHCRG